MARMNDFKRAELLKPRVEEYIAAGLSDHRNARFAQDMIGRAQRGKGFTAAQRKWVESITDNPVPAAQDEALYNRILSAAEAEGLRPRSREILLEFSIKVFNGWKLSEKQNSFLNGLLEEADEVSLNGPWLPSPKQVVDLRTCILLSKRYRHTGFLDSHPGLQKSLIVVGHFLKWTDHSSCLDAKSIAQSGLSEWHVNKLLKQFKTPLAEMASPRHLAGETRYVKIKLHTGETETSLALVIDDPTVDDKGQVAYPVIVNGGMSRIQGRRLKKRGPRSMNA